MNQKLKEFLKPDWKTIVYLIVLTVLAAVSTNVLAVYGGYGSSCVYASIFEASLYVLFFVLDTPAIFMMLFLWPLGAIGFFVALVPECIYLYALARILSRKLPMKYAALLLAAFLLLIVLSTNSDVCPRYGFHGLPNAVGFSKIKPLNPGQLEMSASKGFSGIFINAAGGTVTLKDANMVFTAPAAADCDAAGVAAAVSLPGGDETRLDGATSLQVGQGNTFNFEMADCSGGILREGQRYSATVTLKYTIDVGGVEEARTETGTLSGPVID